MVLADYGMRGEGIVVVIDELREMLLVLGW